MRSILVPAFVLAASSILSVIPASADDECDPAVMHFYKADGLATTRAGWSKLADMCWQAADSNSDGMVSQQEWDAHHGSLFQLLDPDGDGKTSIDEIKGLQNQD